MTIRRFSYRTVYYAVLGGFNFPESIVTIQKAITEGFFSLSLLMLFKVVITLETED